MSGRKRAPGIRYYGPATISTLNRWYRMHGAETPPPCVCSAVRWRIYLAFRKNPGRYDESYGPDTRSRGGLKQKYSWD